MKARPILFSAPMIQALMSGTKSQTRRIVKPQPRGEFLGLLERPIRSMQDEPVLRAWFGAGENETSSTEVTCPYGKPGDVLYVKETWAENRGTVGGVIYKADIGADSYHVFDLKSGDSIVAVDKWRPSIFMPRSVSRLTLEITEVRVERLQSISEEDAKAEGCVYIERPSLSVGYYPAYRELWESINGKGSWAENPFVWCISFKVHRCNVDTLLKERA